MPPAAVYDEAARALALDGGDPVDRAHAQGRTAQLAFELGRADEARACLAAAEPVLLEAGDLRALAMFVGGRAFHEAVHGDHGVGIAEGERAVAFARAARDRELEMIALHAVAVASTEQALSTPEVDREALLRAEAYLGEVLAWARADGSAIDVNATLSSLALAHYVAGDHARALAESQEALRMMVDDGHRFGHVDLVNLGYVAVALGCCREGVMLQAAAVREARRQGLRLQGLDVRLRARAEADARAALGDGELAQAVADGEQLTLDEAVTLALGLRAGR